MNKILFLLFFCFITSISWGQSSIGISPNGDTTYLNGVNYHYKSYISGENNVISEQISGTINNPPFIKIINPAPNDNISYGQRFYVYMNALDLDGSVNKIEVYLNDALVAEKLSAPYTIQILNTNVGYGTLKAKAYDNSGNSRYSNTVTIYSPDTTTAPEIIDTTYNSNPVYISFGGLGSECNAISFDINQIAGAANNTTNPKLSNALDSVGVATTIGLNLVKPSGSLATGGYTGGSVGQVQPAPYCAWSTAWNIPYGNNLIFELFGLSVNSTYLLHLTFTGNNISTDRVNVNINNGQTRFRFIGAINNTSQVEEVVVRSNSSGVIRVEVSPVSSESTMLPWIKLYSVTLDTSAAANIPPVVGVVEPSNGANITQNTFQEFVITATDSDGIIDSVQFYRNSTLVSTDLIFPFKYTLPTTVVATDTIFAIAYDNDLASTSSDTIVYNIVSP